MHGVVLLLLNEGLVVHLLLAVALVSLLTHHLLLLIVSIFFRFGDCIHLMRTNVEVRTLQLLVLVVKTLDFELVRMHLCLVVFKFGNHFFQLLSAFLKVDLILAEFLSHVRTALLSQDILQLDVEFLFFLDKHIFLRNFFSLCNQALLQALDFLNQLVSLDVGGLKFSPSVNIEWFLKLVRQILGLLLLLKQFLLKQVNFSLQIWDALSFFLGVNQLALDTLDVVL